MVQGSVFVKTAQQTSQNAMNQAIKNIFRETPFNPITLSFSKTGQTRNLKSPISDSQTIDRVQTYSYGENDTCSTEKQLSTEQSFQKSRFQKISKFYSWNYTLVILCALVTACMDFIIYEQFIPIIFSIVSIISFVTHQWGGKQQNR